MLAVHSRFHLRADAVWEDALAAGEANGAECVGAFHVNTVASNVCCVLN